MLNVRSSDFLRSQEDGGGIGSPSSGGRLRRCLRDTRSDTNLGQLPSARRSLLGKRRQKKPASNATRQGRPDRIRRLRRGAFFAPTNRGSFTWYVDCPVAQGPPRLARGLEER